jgi:AraC family transcriptional regulator of adaptative response / DNA-3-methyladenine glycosylase II
VGLDADVEAASRHLRADPVMRPLVLARPGIRPPGAWDPFEAGVRAIVGQRISVAGASTIAARIVERHGAPVPGLRGLGLTHVFPTASALAGADLGGLGLPSERAEAVRAFARAVDEGALRLDEPRTLDGFVHAVMAIRGLGPWTAHYLALRLGDPDAFPAADLGVRRRLSLALERPVSTREATRIAEGWRPWRAHAAVHLWMDGTGGRVAAASTPHNRHRAAPSPRVRTG